MTGTPLSGSFPRRAVLLILLTLPWLCFSAVPISSHAWTDQDKDLWKKSVKRVVTTPPCCGACGILSMDDGRKAYRYILGEDASTEAAAIYRDNEKKLMEAFRFFSPERYEYWFGETESKGERK